MRHVNVHVCRFTVWAIATTLALSLSGCASSGSAGTGLPPSSDPALDAGRTLAESKCTRCHTLDRIKSANHDAAAWEATVARMRGNGAVLTDAEAESIVSYLSTL